MNAPINFSNAYQALKGNVHTLEASEIEAQFRLCLALNDKSNTETLLQQVESLLDIVWSRPEVCSPILVAEAFASFMGARAAHKATTSFFQKPSVAKSCLLLSFALDKELFFFEKGMNPSLVSLLLTLGKENEAKNTTMQLMDYVGPRLLGVQWDVVKSLFELEAENYWQLSELLASIPVNAEETINKPDVVLPNSFSELI